MRNATLHIILYYNNTCVFVKKLLPTYYNMYKCINKITTDFTVIGVNIGATTFPRSEWLLFRRKKYGNYLGIDLMYILIWSIKQMQANRFFETDVALWNSVLCVSSVKSFVFLLLSNRKRKETHYMCLYAPNYASKNLNSYSYLKFVFFFLTLVWWYIYYLEIHCILYGCGA